MVVCGVGTMIHIKDLPEELLLKVFSNLPVRDLVRISRVCHRWNRVSRDRWLWEHVDLTTCSIQPRNMGHLCSYMAPHLQSLRLSGFFMCKTRSEMSVSGVSTMIHINDLPEELLLKVFSNLPVRDLVRISRVCHRWNRVSRDRWLWKHVDLTTCSMRPRIMWHLLCCYMAPHLQSLSLRGCFYTCWHNHQLPSKLMLGLDVKCPQLRRLSLHAVDLHNLPLCSLPSTLHALELHSCDMDEDWLVTMGSVCLPPLESLVLKDMPDVSDHLLKELGRLPSLHSLVLVRASCLTEWGLDAGLRELRGLQHLGILNCCLSTDRVLGILVQYLTRLQSLCVSAHRLSVISLKQLHALPNLESLTLVGPVLSSQIPNPRELLAALQGVPKLRTLEILRVYSAGNQEEAKEVLCKGLPRCKVTLSSCISESWI